jgi:hypothetical protein
MPLARLKYCVGSENKYMKIFSTFKILKMLSNYYIHYYNLSVILLPLF